MIFDIKYYRKYINSIVNNGLMEKKNFIDDWVPVGESVLQELVRIGLVRETPAYGTIYLEIEPFRLKELVKDLDRLKFGF